MDINIPSTVGFIFGGDLDSTASVMQDAGPEIRGSKASSFQY